MNIRGTEASLSAAFGHQAPAPAELFSRAYRGPWLESHEVDTVICVSGIGDAPLTNSFSAAHVGSKRQSIENV